MPPSAICSARLNLRHFSASVSAPRGPRGPVIARKTPGPISFCALLAFFGVIRLEKKSNGGSRGAAGEQKEQCDDERSSSEYTRFREGTGSPFVKKKMSSYPSKGEMERGDLLRVVDMQARARFREASEGVEGAARAAARFAGSHGKELGAGAALLGGALLAEAVRRRAQARGGVHETEVAQEAERLETEETLAGTGAPSTKAMPARALVVVGDAESGPASSPEMPISTAEKKARNSAPRSNAGSWKVGKPPAKFKPLETNKKRGARAHGAKGKDPEAKSEGDAASAQGVARSSYAPVVDAEVGHEEPTVERANKDGAKQEDDRLESAEFRPMDRGERAHDAKGKDPESKLEGDTDSAPGVAHSSDAPLVHAEEASVQGREEPTVESAKKDGADKEDAGVDLDELRRMRKMETRDLLRSNFGENVRRFCARSRVHDLCEIVVLEDEQDSDISGIASGILSALREREFGPRTPAQKAYLDRVLNERKMYDKIKSNDISKLVSKLGADLVDKKIRSRGGVGRAGMHAFNRRVQP